MPNPPSNTNWESFWKDNPAGFNETMAKSTLFFAQRLHQEFPIKADDRILDIGCGPGFLISYLKSRCSFVSGTDISENYIAVCEEKFAENSNTSFTLSNAYDFEAYGRIIIDQKINRVILLSVLQYYKSTQEVRSLIEHFKRVGRDQPFSCLLADIIPTKHSTTGDIINIVTHALRNGYTIKFMRFLMYAMFSDYRKIKKSGFLQIDEAFFSSLAQELDLDLRIIKNLTIHTGRYSVLINFK